jgi:REP element-mobilizing transposase RayT
MRVRKGLPNLRRKPLAGLVFSAFRAAKEGPSVRLAQFSVQSNHLHLIVEADGHRALSRAMQGLAIRLARRLNARLGRRGSVFSDRYHARALRTPLEVRRALVYVLNNHRRHHTGRGRPSRFDVFSTAAYFDGFTTPILRWPKSGFVPPKEPPVAQAKTWLLRVGWRRLGLLTPSDSPAAER